MTLSRLKKAPHTGPLRKPRGAARIRRTYNGRTPWPLAVSQKISKLWQTYLAERGYTAAAHRLENLRSKIYRELDHGASCTSSSVRMADVLQLLKMSTFVKNNLSSSRSGAAAGGWRCSLADEVDHAGLPMQACQQCAVHGWRCFSGFTLEDVKKSETRLCLHCMQCRFMTCSKCCL